MDTTVQTRWKRSTQLLACMDWPAAGLRQAGLGNGEGKKKFHLPSMESTIALLHFALPNSPIV
jgi:hypothetical protein